MRKKYFIYKLTSPSGLVYIGQTRNLHARLLNYYHMKKENSEQALIANEISLHGIDSFKIEVLKLNLTKFQANIEEIKYIKIFKDLNTSLNISNGGNFDAVESFVTYMVDEFGNILKEYESSAAAARDNKLHQSGIFSANKRMSFYCKGKFFIYKKYYDKGMFSNRIRKAADKMVPIIQMDLNYNIINKFDSITDASNATGIGKEPIRDILYNKRKSKGKFIWIIDKERLNK